MRWGQLRSSRRTWPGSPGHPHQWTGPAHRSLQRHRETHAQHKTAQKPVSWVVCSSTVSRLWHVTGTTCLPSCLQLPPHSHSCWLSLQGCCWHRLSCCVCMQPQRRHAACAGQRAAIRRLLLGAKHSTQKKSNSPRKATIARRPCLISAVLRRKTLSGSLSLARPRGSKKPPVATHTRSQGWRESRAVCCSRCCAVCARQGVHMRKGVAHRFSIVHRQHSTQRHVADVQCWICASPQPAY